LTQVDGLLVFLFLALQASQRRRGALRRGLKVKLILRSYVIGLGGAFRCDFGRALGCDFGRSEALRYRQQQEGSDCCSCGKSGHFLLVSMCVAVWCVDLVFIGAR
jgi:hypothetical protein